MSTDTQISTYLIPVERWYQGWPDRLDLPPIVRPAQDALDIERRDQRDVRLRNEAHRYLLCCERIQGIVKTLADDGILHPAYRFVSRNAAAPDRPTAAAYIAVVDIISRSLRGSPYPRVSATFFPPEDARKHLQVLGAILSNKKIEELFDRASKQGSIGQEIVLTAENCRKASEARLQVLQTAAAGEYGIVDVVEVV